MELASTPNSQTRKIIFNKDVAPSKMDADYFMLTGLRAVAVLWTIDKVVLNV